MAIDAMRNTTAASLFAPTPQMRARDQENVSRQGQENGAMRGAEVAQKRRRELEAAAMAQARGGEATRVRREAAMRPVVNALGQKTGTIVNTSA
ncbi:MAG: hypothetical protein N2441_02285 [Rhodocyclaceae bacterium]|nr:hypothetical protein [Rhodocyclaceae bacterium]